MPREGAEDLISAVAEAMGRKKLNVNNFEDRLLVQKGCFLLNEKGVEPKYDFGMYIKGPYSAELADDQYVLSKKASGKTNVETGLIDEVSEIMKKGTAFTEAYTTLLLVSKYNPYIADGTELTDIATKVRPDLKKEIKEAAKSLTAQVSVI
jgi:uncharacterized protein YwgA